MNPPVFEMLSNAIAFFFVMGIKPTANRVYDALALLDMGKEHRDRAALHSNG